MVNSELNPREWRDIQVLRARGVLAEVLVVDLVEADHALWAYAHAPGTSLQEVARQVRDRELIIDRESCVMPRRDAGYTALLERSSNAVELTRKVYLRLPTPRTTQTGAVRGRPPAA